jgi:hypothetical protein
MRNFARIKKVSQGVTLLWLFYGGVIPGKIFRRKITVILFSLTHNPSFELCNILIYLSYTTMSYVSKLIKSACACLDTLWV